MHPQYAALVLAGEYDSIEIPSTLAARGHKNLVRKCSKTLSNYFARKDFQWYARRQTETVSQWKTRLHLRLGEWSEYVSPPRLIVGRNNRKFYGYSGILWMNEVDTESLQIALLLALLIQKAQDKKWYSARNLLEPLYESTAVYVIPELIGRAENGMACLEDFLSRNFPEAQHRKNGQVMLPLELWGSIFPKETIAKAQSWIGKKDGPPVFGRAPECLCSVFSITAEQPEPTDSGQEFPPLAKPRVSATEATLDAVPPQTPQASLDVSRWKYLTVLMVMATLGMMSIAGFFLTQEQSRKPIKHKNVFVWANPESVPFLEQLSLPEGNHRLREKNFPPARTSPEVPPLLLVPELP